jgi:GRASP55/65 PDZ-like domain
MQTTVVWNIKAQQKRIVHLRPQEGWGGAGLLGVTIRLDNYGGAEDRLVRVLNVQPHSPAAGEFCFSFSASTLSIAMDRSFLSE